MVGNTDLSLNFIAVAYAKAPFQCLEVLQGRSMSKGRRFLLFCFQFLCSKKSLFAAGLKQ